MFVKQLAAFALLAGVTFASPLERRAATSTFLTPPKTSSLSKPITVAKGQTFTLPTVYMRYDRGSGACGGQSEGGNADAVFLLEDGAMLKNVVIGANQAEGVHCLGSCTLGHVYFEDVCEDAITIKQTSGTSYINYGGAKYAEDKVVQHNGGGKVVINSFYVEDFGKLYRLCRNCKTQYKRAVEINDVWAKSGKLLAGINSNYDDTATIRSTKAQSVKTICETFKGNNSGKEPSADVVGPSTYCKYSVSDISS